MRWRGGRANPGSIFRKKKRAFWGTFLKNGAKKERARLGTRLVFCGSRHELYMVNGDDELQNTTRHVEWSPSETRTTSSTAVLLLNGSAYGRVNVMMFFIASRLVHSAAVICCVGTTRSLGIVGPHVGKCRSFLYSGCMPPPVPPRASCMQQKAGM